MSDKWESLLSEHQEMQAPFMCKIRFYAPSRFKEEFEKIQQKNASHIEYIGTRPGVENVDEESLLGTAAGHVKYIDERPRSHGLFSGVGEEPDMKAIQDELGEHQGVVWRIVLSLTEEDAKRLDHISRKSWENTLRATVPAAAAKMGIGETNLRWVAAFHQEKGHPHVHLVVWEKQPKRRKGMLSDAERKDVRKTFQNVIYAEERNRLFQEKTATRDLIRDLSKRELVDMVQVIREIKSAQQDVELELQAIGEGRTGIPPKFTDSRALEVAKQINYIASILPKKGRIVYKFMPEDVKEAVNATTKQLLSSHAFKDSIRRYKQSVESMTRQYSFKDQDIKKAIDKAMADLEKRVSQHVLRAAAESQKMGRAVIPEKARIAVQKFSQAVGRPMQNLDREVLKKSVEALNDFGYSSWRQEEIISSWVGAAEFNVTKEEINSILENVEYRDQPITSPDERLKNANIVAGILKLSGRDNESIKQTLERSGFDPEDVKKISQESKALDTKINDGFISKSDWKRFTDNMGVILDYPWVPAEDVTILQEHKDAFIDALRTCQFSSDIDQGEKGYTAFCLAVALKQLDVDETERSTIMQAFAIRNEVDEIGRILSRVNEVDTSYLRKVTWERLNNNLQMDLKYPWHTEEALVCDIKKYQDALKVLNTSNKYIESPDEIKWTAETYAQFLRRQASPDEVRSEIKDWSRRSNLSEQSLEDIELMKKRTNDVQLMARKFGIVDQIRETITNLTKVLVAAGLDHDQLHGLIKDWNTRSGANINEEQLTKMVETAEKSARDADSWGRPPIVSRKDFQKLCDTLEVKTDYIWEGRDGRTRNQSNSINLAKLLWKQAWQAIEQERMRTHAQGEMLKQKLQRQRERQAERESQREKDI